MTDTMTPVPVCEQLPAIRALAALAAAFPALPSDTVTVGTVIAPDRIAQGLRVDLHAASADFEAWREALAIDPAQVEHKELSRFQTLSAYAESGGVPVQLIAYMPLTTAVLAAA
ncbi:hypothetical protein ACX6XY_17790 [Streptomyces sp. O3]